MNRKVCAVILSLVLGIVASVHAQSVPVDATNTNIGALSPSVVFGGPETYRCPIIIHRGQSAPTCTTPTGEGISSVRQLFNGTLGPVGITPIPVRSSNLYGLDFWTANFPRLSITHDGLVGIGTTAPSYPLDVESSGDVQIALKSSDGGRTWTVQSSGKEIPTLAGTFQIIDRTQNKARLIIDANGVVSVSSLQITGGADLAEPFSSHERIERGAAVVIDEHTPGQLRLSDRAYDPKVVGIVSGAGSISPGLILTQLSSDKTDIPVAITGRVYALADTSGGSIEPGDLLTTSKMPGHVMKATDPVRSRGAVIGKAMSGLAKGNGLVLVLVGLQ